MAGNQNSTAQAVSNLAANAGNISPLKMAWQGDPTGFEGLTETQLDSMTLDTTLVGTNIDAFSRVRTSEPGYRFDSQLTYAIDADLWDTSTTGGSVAHSSAERYALLTATAGAANKAILQGHYCAPYTAGRGQLGLVTFVMGATPGTGVERRVGLYDETLATGIYLSQTASATSLVVAGGTTLGTQTVAQGSWNIDPLNGTGPSGVTLDLTKVQILVIQFQALYVGSVTIGFDIDGSIVPVHRFDHANEVAYPYILNANLPVHYSVRTSSAQGTMAAVCCSVISEGGESLFALSGRDFTANNAITPISVTTRRAVLTIRAKQTLNSINQTAVAIPIGVQVLAQTNGSLVEIVRNGTLGGAPAWTNVDTTYSIMEYDVAGTTVTGGEVVDSFYAPAGSGSTRGSATENLGKLVLAYSHLLAAGDTVSVVCTSLTGTSSVLASIDWAEIR